MTPRQRKHSLPQLQHPQFPSFQLLVSFVLWSHWCPVKHVATAETISHNPFASFFLSACLFSFSHFSLEVRFSQVMAGRAGVPGSRNTQGSGCLSLFIFLIPFWLFCFETKMSMKRDFGKSCQKKKYFVEVNLDKIKLNCLPLVISPLSLILLFDLAGYTEDGPDFHNNARCLTKEFPKISFPLSFFLMLNISCSYFVCFFSCF